MRVEYDFLRVGSVVEPRRGYIYIDIGNRSLPGVIDTHAEVTEATDFVCSSSLLAAQPDLVTGWIGDDDLAGPIHLVMHENPDYDCIASSFLVRRLLDARANGKELPDAWNDWAFVIADSARRIDRGETRLRLSIQKERPPLTPYLSMIAMHDQIARESLAPKEEWSKLIDRGHAILERAIGMAREQGIADLNEMDLRGALSDLGDLETIIDAKVHAFARDAHHIGLDRDRHAHAGSLDGIFDIRLPRSGHPADVAAAKIACIRDPESGAGFFKSVIRGAYAESIQALCIFSTMPADPVAGTESWVRAVISVDPDSPWDLRGLGQHLDTVETKVRRKKGLPRAGRPRPGFDNSDPWYDGRAFAYTIVDAPRWGTVLVPQEVLAEVLNCDAWLSVRVSAIVSELLEQVRVATDPATRRTAYAAIASAVRFWSAHPSARDLRLYTACVDAVVSFATRDHAELYRPALEAAPDVVLGLLLSADPAVRIDSLAIAARDVSAYQEIAQACGRGEMLPLLTIVAGGDGEAARVIATAVTRAPELLLDAVAVRARNNRLESGVLLQAASLASRSADLPQAWHSIVYLTGALRAGPEAVSLESIARDVASRARTQTTTEARAVVADALLLGLLDDAALSVQAPPEEVPAPADVRQCLERGQLLRSAEMLRVLAADPRVSLVALLDDLLRRAGAADPELEDRPLAEACREILATRCALFGAAVLLDRLSERAVAVAARLSPDISGGLLRAAPFSRMARWRLVEAALDTRWQSALGEARTHVLTPADWQMFREVQALTRAAIIARSLDLPLPVCNPRRLAFLLLTASSARGAERETRAYDVLSRLAAEDEAIPAGDVVCDARTLLVDELRHTAPDHHLQADAEPCFTKLELFARTIEIAGHPESVAETAILALFRLALRLPEIDFTIVDELLRLRRQHGGGDSVQDDVARQALELAVALERAREHGGLATEVERVHTAAAAIAALARACPAGPLGWAAALALRDVETVLDTYAAALERVAHGDARSLDEYSPGVLQASTISRIARDFGDLRKAGSAGDAVTLASRLAEGAGDDVRAVRQVCSRVRVKLGGAASNARAYRRAVKSVGAGSSSKITVDAAYGRIRDHLALPASALDVVYARIVDTHLASYDIHRARPRIDEYSFVRLALLLRFWMSGASILVPPLLLALFVATSSHDLDQDVVGLIIENTTLVVIAALVMAIALEWCHKLRSTAEHRIVDSLRYRLLLPNYVLLLVFGVYTASITDEFTAHLAMQLDDWRYGMLAAGFFLTATWALGQLVRRGGQKVSIRSVLVASSRLFTYAFLIALALNLMLAPLTEYELGLHERRVQWIGMQSHTSHGLPFQVETDGLSLMLFPRHILLDALFGMFIGICMRGLWKMQEEE